MGLVSLHKHFDGMRTVIIKVMFERQNGATINL